MVLTKAVELLLRATHEGEPLCCAELGRMNRPAMQQFFQGMESDPSHLDSIAGTSIARFGELGRCSLRVFGLPHKLFRRLEDGRCRG